MVAFLLFLLPPLFVDDALDHDFYFTIFISLFFHLDGGMEELLKYFESFEIAGEVIER